MSPLKAWSLGQNIASHTLPAAIITCWLACVLTTHAVDPGSFIGDPVMQFHNADVEIYVWRLGGCKEEF